MYFYSFLESNGRTIRYIATEDAAQPNVPLCIDDDNIISSADVTSEFLNDTEKWYVSISLGIKENDVTNEIFYFSSFITRRLFRHKGYGRKLLKHVKEQYKGKIIYLGVSSLGQMSNKQLVDFYKSEGFVEFKCPYSLGYKGLIIKC